MRPTTCPDRPPLVMHLPHAAVPSPSAVAQDAARMHVPPQRTLTNDRPRPLASNLQRLPLRLSRDLQPRLAAFLTLRDIARVLATCRSDSALMQAVRSLRLCSFADERGLLHDLHLQSVVRSVPDLRELRLRHTEPDDSCQPVCRSAWKLAPVAQLARLAHLDLRDRPLHEDSVAQLPRTLKALRVKLCRVDSGCDFPPGLESLRVDALSAKYATFTPAFLQSVGELRHLKWLHLCGSQLPSLGFLEAAALEHLALRLDGLGDEAHLPITLRTLSLHVCEMKGGTRLRALTALSDLDVAGCFHVLAHLPAKLNSLTLHDLRSCEHLVHLKQSSLEILHLEFVYALDLLQLPELLPASLRRLELSACELDHSLLHVLRDRLPASCTLTLDGELVTASAKAASHQAGLA